jgi:hypothetical protein
MLGWCIGHAEGLVVKVTTGAAAAATVHTDRVDLFARAGGAQRVLELVYPVRLTASGVVEVELTPVVGKTLICGVMLEPVRYPPHNVK